LSQGRYTIERVNDPACWLCGRPTYDPGKKDLQWSRGVAGGRQVLVCPACQIERADWRAELDRCVACGSVRLSLMLGEVVCRACGHEGSSPAVVSELDGLSSTFTGA
jgi:hypothetical protein